MTWMVFKRMVVTGAKSFVRGGAVSAATVVIMTVTLGIIGSLFFLSGLLTFTLDNIRDKVDVSISFIMNASEAEVLAVKSQIEKLPQVASVTYTSREEILAQFKEKNAGDQLNLGALEELGYNPFGARLSVLAKDPSQYASIVSFLEASPTLSADGSSIVDRINYARNKDAIDRLSLWIQATQSIGLAIVILFAIASILIAFATIRLAIYTAKDEIAVMRLVGASNIYVQGPFIVTGIITGGLASLLVLLLLWPATWYAGGKTASWLGGFDVASYYSEHFAFLALLLIVAGIVLGAIASVLAIRKYLKA